MRVYWKRCRDILASKSCPLDARKHVVLVQKLRKSWFHNFILSKNKKCDAKMIIPSFCELPHLQYLPTAKCTTSSKHSPVFFFFATCCSVVFGRIRLESFCLQQSHKYWFNSLCLATMVWKRKSLICENEWGVFRGVTDWTYSKSSDPEGWVVHLELSVKLQQGNEA